MTSEVAERKRAHLQLKGCLLLMEQGGLQVGLVTLCFRLSFIYLPHDITPQLHTMSAIVSTCFPTQSNDLVFRRVCDCMHSLAAAELCEQEVGWH